MRNRYINSPGGQLVREGAACMPDLLPNSSARAPMAPLILARAHYYMRTTDRGTQNVGFFLYGLALAAGGQSHA